MSRDPAPHRAVLDTDIIFSRVLHELFGRLARQARRFDLIWSDELLDEAARVLVERKPMDEPTARRWVERVSTAFPEGRVDLATLTDTVILPTLTSDPGDEHVCALALAGVATLIVASDKGYNIEELAIRGVTVTTPDAYLLQALDEEPEVIVGLLNDEAAAWGGAALWAICSTPWNAPAPCSSWGASVQAPRLLRSFAGSYEPHP